MTQEIVYAYLKSHPLFTNVSEQMLKDASEKMKIKTVYRGESFGYGEGDFSKIYLLIKGKIKIAELNSDSNELIKDLLTSPDIFGDLSLEGKPDTDEFAEALTANTVVCIINCCDLKKMLNTIPGMAMSYASMVNKKLKKMESRHSDLVFCDAKSRLVRFIQDWAKNDGNRMGDKIILDNYLTHTDIANVISTSRQSVNVLLNELRDSGFLFYNRKRIELNSPVIWN
jgi:CRP/FNR family transcriptional regulator, cyclic AMP receptor protein